ncbi:hypothetical protein ES150_01720 [Enterobacillus tribolii]|nr:hypothetical protein [Enterobacillus tribolii]
MEDAGMFSQRWQTGVDISPGGMCAVALSRRRDGWQLKRWWQLSPPADLFCDGRLQRPRQLGEWLRDWRRELPANARIRLGLPPAQVMQRYLPRPDRQLSPAVRQEALRIAVEKQFHLSCKEMAYDYAPAARDGDGVVVTAARRRDLQGWLDAMSVAGLTPDAVDITPCALRRVAALCGTPPDKLLLYRTSQTLLWVSPRPQPLAYGCVAAGDDDVSQAVCAALQAGFTGDGYLLSGAAAPAEWSPFGFLRQLQPPLPRQPQDFTLALGLALHPGAEAWI